MGDGVAVEHSVSGRRWRLRGEGGRAAELLVQRLGISEIVARLLAQRGIGCDEAAGFLAPRLRDLLPEPLSLRDMDRAVARVVAALAAGERIAVFGDYDVDGATSAALLLRFFGAVGATARLYVPDRLAEGYGPNAPALMRLKDEGVRVVLTVDCGTAAHQALEAAAAAGLDVIVLDHHVAEPLLPPAHAIVNPNRLDESGGHGNLAAVGITYLFVVALNRALRQRGWYAQDRAEPDLLSWLDLVALGTVCDVVALLGLNRALVAQGIKVARNLRNPGIRALAARAKVEEPLDAYHLGFILGPRVNAGGRVGASDLGARLLATDDPVVAAELAERLDALNRERRELEARTIEEAIEAVEAGPQSPVLAFAAAKGWHPGVIGIVAARLKERYQRPACVVALSGGIGRGSGRSLAALPLGPAVLAARQAGLLVNGGGHAMAAGFTVLEDQVEALRQFLAERLGDGRDGAPLVAELAIDAAITLAAAGAGLVREVAALGPFGAANPEPRFLLRAVRIAHIEPVGAAHLRLMLAEPLGAARLRAVAFRVADRPLGRFLVAARGLAIDIAGHLQQDRWRGGEAVQFVVDDAAPASGDAGDRA